MPRQCVIYYGTVVNEEGDGWAEKGSHSQEPIKVEGQEAFGKEPEFCCDGFGKAMAESAIVFMPYHPQLQLSRGWNLKALEVVLHFCPFCGAEVSLKEDLKLKVVAEQRVIYAYHYEKEAHA